MRPTWHRVRCEGMVRSLMLAVAFAAALATLADASSESSAFSSVLDRSASDGISSINRGSHADAPPSPSHQGHSDSNVFPHERDPLEATERVAHAHAEPEGKGLSGRPPADPLAAHFRSRLRSFFQKARSDHAADTGSTEVLNLPAVAAAGVHNFDLRLSRRSSRGSGSTRYSGEAQSAEVEEAEEDDEALYAAMLAHEARAHALKPQEARSYVACGAQAHASSARLALSSVDQAPRKVPRPLGGHKKTGNSKQERTPPLADFYKPRMAYTSRREGVACWLAQLNVSGVAELRSLPQVFTHVSPVPAAAKLSPGLLLSEPSKMSTESTKESPRTGAAAAASKFVALPQQPRLRVSEHVFGAPPRLPPRREDQTTSHLSPGLRGTTGETSSSSIDWSSQGLAAVGAAKFAEWQGFEGRGLRVHFSPDVATSSHAAREKLVASWLSAGFGLLGGSSGSKTTDNENVQPSAFFPLLSDEEQSDDEDNTVHDGVDVESSSSKSVRNKRSGAEGLWGPARAAAQEGLCASVLGIHLKPLPMDGPLALAFSPRSPGFKSTSTETRAAAVVETIHETCALVALGFLASQPLVERIEVAPRMRIHNHASPEAGTKSDNERADEVVDRFPNGISKEEDSSRRLSTRQRPAGVKNTDIEQRIEEFIRASQPSPATSSTAATVATGVSSRETSTAPLPGRPRKLNYYAKSAVQAPGNLDSTPFTSLNITGHGQYVQITDTGFDDASCWLRHYDPASFVGPPSAEPTPSPTHRPTHRPTNGTESGSRRLSESSLFSTDIGVKANRHQRRLDNAASTALSCSDADLTNEATVYECLNLDWQVERSEFDDPITDYRFRKVVQYVGVHGWTYFSQGHYLTDVEFGSGTHSAGVVCGSTDPGSLDDDEVVEVFGDTYSKCAQYIDYCDSLFCPTCDLSGSCDSTCGLAPDNTEDYSGIATGAKIMAYDFSDHGGDYVEVPTVYGTRMWYPAYDAGARIHSNGWGSTDGYYDEATQGADEYVYDTDDALVIFSAGEEGSNGAITINNPGVAKNCLTVGGARTEDTATSPETATSTTSRGPTMDGRIKPDIMGPGDPVWSAYSSGFFAFATCAVTREPGHPASRAAPALAGAAALLREFITDDGPNGVFAKQSPVGYAASSYSATAPSAALIKALLIGSTTPLLYGFDPENVRVDLEEYYSGERYVEPPCGCEENGVKFCTFSESDTSGYCDFCADYATSANCASGKSGLSSDGAADCVQRCFSYLEDGESGYSLGAVGVDFTQGFGHVRLANAFSVDEESAFETFMYEPTLPEYSVWSQSFTVSDRTVGLTATLVWTDPPGSVYCGYGAQTGFYSGGCLVHDLDLKVYVGGQRVYSNFGNAIKGQYSGQEDALNNVEKVAVEKFDLSVGDVVQVQVHSYGLSYANFQKFALVITGGLTPDAAPTPSPSLSAAPTALPTARDHRTCSEACAESPEYLAALASGSSLQVCQTDYSCTVQCGNYTYFKAACECGLMDEYLSAGIFDKSAFKDEYCCGTDVCKSSIADLIGQNENLLEYVELETTCEEVTCRPSGAPTSVPAPLPSAAPTPDPTSTPTPVPTLAPSMVPTPVPSLQPTPVPTLMPTPSPSPVPTLQPTPVPTLMPSPSPSPVPSLMPTPVPTLVPSPLPTTSPTEYDTVGVNVKLDVEARAPPTDHDRLALKAAISNATRVPMYDLKGYQLSWANTSGLNADGTSIGRPTPFRRTLLAGSYLWTAVVELSTPVSMLPERFNLTNRDQFADYIAEIFVSPTFAALVSEELESARASVNGTALSVITATRSPSGAPTPAPSPRPTPLPTTPRPTPSPRPSPQPSVSMQPTPMPTLSQISAEMRTAMAASAGGLALVCFLCFLGVAFGRMRFHHWRQPNSSGNNDDSVEIDARKGRKAALSPAQNMIKTSDHELLYSKSTPTSSTSSIRAQAYSVAHQARAASQAQRDADQVNQAIVNAGLTRRAFAQLGCYSDAEIGNCPDGDLQYILGLKKPQIRRFRNDLPADLRGGTTL